MVQSRKEDFTAEEIFQLAIRKEEESRNFYAFGPKHGGTTMKRLGDFIQAADWKKEKHVPVIECPDTVKAGELLQIMTSVGKEIKHPNTTEHHIRWIRLFFQPEGGKYTYLIGNFEFCAHGESAEGPNTGPIYTDPHASAMMKTTMPGVIYAISFCNIHGLWENSKELKLS